MIRLSRQERTTLFRSLFRGREDVFAKHWTKYDGSVSGYVPVYDDWKRKTYKELTDSDMKRHLFGKLTIGLYPLLSDNTSYFIAADFDGKTWLADAKRFIKVCDKHSLSVYLERSRSGNGGHVWCFFRGKYPAYKSRAIFFHLLKQSKNVDEFTKPDSFDRLFPNQDQHSAKGLGNLVALPLQAQSRKKDNAVFLDPVLKYEPALDQWEFLESIEEASSELLDDLFDKLSNTKERQKRSTSGSLEITLANKIMLLKEQMTSSLTNFLREELNFLNTERFAKERMGFSTYNIEKYFKTVTTDDSNVFIPRGFLSHLTQFLDEQDIPFELMDQRIKRDPIKFKPTFELFDYQKEALGKICRVDGGVLVAPPGSGKTVIGLALIAKHKQSALILTHRRQIYSQWLENTESFLGIPKKDIGQYCAAKKKVQSPITIGMVQSFSKVLGWEPFQDQFGLVIVDECHHVPARMFRDVVNRFNPHYLYGLTATPKRKHNDEKLIYAYLGDLIYEIPRDYAKHSKDATYTDVTVTIHDTDFMLPFKPKTTDFQILTKQLVFDAGWNTLIANDVKEEITKHKSKCLILTERKEHVELLHYFLKRDFETVTFSGDLAPLKRQQHEEQISRGDFQILVATGQILGEGSDIGNLDALFLVFPFSFEGKLVQYIGRIERGEEKIKRVYDYSDKHIAVLDRLFRQHNRYYNKLKKL